MKILFVLQNAYRSSKYNFKNDQEWHRDLKRSHTGRRLQEMIPDGVDVYVINSSPIIGNTPGSCFKADEEYLKNKLTEINADYVCGCGKIAQNGLDKIGIRFVVLPHPAWRALSKDHTSFIKDFLTNLIKHKRPPVRVVVHDTSIN
jgi:hypothetical protein